MNEKAHMHFILCFFFYSCCNAETLFRLLYFVFIWKKVILKIASVLNEKEKIYPLGDTKCFTNE